MKVVKITKKNGVKDTYHIVVEMSTKELDVAVMNGVDWSTVTSSKVPRVITSPGPIPPSWAMIPPDPGVAGAYVITA